MEKSSSKKQKAIPNHLLKRARERRGWSHEDIANLINLPDAGMMSRWERGVSFPHPRYRQALSNLFQMSLEDLGLTQHNRYRIEQTSTPLNESQPAKPLYKIPRQLTSFIGREKELREVSELLARDDVQLVNVLGPGILFRLDPKKISQ